MGQNSVEVLEVVLSDVPATGISSQNHTNINNYIVQCPVYNMFHGLLSRNMICMCPHVHFCLLVCCSEASMQGGFEVVRMNPLFLAGCMYYLCDRLMLDDGLSLKDHGQRSATAHV